MMKPNRLNETESVDEKFLHASGKEERLKK